MTKKLDTKQKIITVAIKEFSDFGFDGASVREIARKAKVNLAAINYHFKTKENLYHEVIEFGISGFVEKIKNYSEKKKRTTSEYCVGLYDMLLEDGPQMINQFKFFLTDIKASGNILEENKQMGPPGHEYIWACLKNEIKSKTTKEDEQWAVRVIFTFIVHTALMASTHFGKRHCSDLFNKKKIHETIIRLVKSVIKDLNS